MQNIYTTNTNNLVCYNQNYSESLFVGLAFSACDI